VAVRPGPRLEALEGRRLLAGPVYHLVDLGTLGGTSFATGINVFGEVTGYSTTANGYRAFLSGPNGGALKNLGTLNGQGTAGQGVNDQGQVTGNSDPGNVGHPFLSQPGGGFLMDLATLGGPTSGAGLGVNNGGRVSGFFYIGNNTSRFHAFLTGPNGGGMMDLGTLGATIGNDRSIGYSVNDVGEVTGTSTTVDPNTIHAFLTGLNGVGMMDLGSLGGSNSGGLSVNDVGQVVGYSTLANNFTIHAFLSKSVGSPLVDLGTLGGDRDSEAFGINHAGQVVGWSGDSNANIHRAFLYSGGVMYNLTGLLDNGTGWTVTDANGINASGQIAATGTGPGGVTHALLLTPVTDTTPPTTTAALAGPAGSHGWYVGPVTVTLSATDPDDPPSGLVITYKLDGGPFQTYTAPFTVAADGLHFLTLQSRDPAGNLEPQRTLTIAVDQTPPTLTASAYRVTLRGNVIGVTGRISDAASGVDPTQASYTLTDSSGHVLATGPVTVNADGTYGASARVPGGGPGIATYTFTVADLDQAGNRGTATASVTGPASQGSLAASTTLYGPGSAGGAVSIPLGPTVLIAPPPTVSPAWPAGPPALWDGSTPKRDRPAWIPRTAWEF
jgi:probable HAF family extracellular repeat protein